MKDKDKNASEKYVEHIASIIDRNIGSREHIYEPDFEDTNGYHLINIEKGIIGNISKIEEELNELKDAESQNSKIMIMVELSDLYGAIEAYCFKQGISMEDLKIFSDITKRAFKNGSRK